ncbi:Hypothetical protein SMAX5B_019025 [Scophthalmus maximus]|uniref:Uncharacterized protein n=1 Tax=Scophthalmus maximus TaxID=52904 RepID=A0A2U9C9W4_SCOMX|nr:Hypothetical protein SMAX5B_019025 [Scophthalmus maximus]
MHGTGLSGHRPSLALSCLCLPRPACPSTLHAAAPLSTHPARSQLTCSGLLFLSFSPLRLSSRCRQRRRFGNTRRHWWRRVVTASPSVREWRWRLSVSVRLLPRLQREGDVRG